MLECCGPPPNVRGAEERAAQTVCKICDFTKRGISHSTLYAYKKTNADKNSCRDFGLKHPLVLIHLNYQALPSLPKNSKRSL